jgi:cytochrome c553
MKNITLFLTILLFCTLQADELSAKKVFEKYCWGCHHQTAMAFGPPFSEIANKRTKTQIKAYISSPISMYKDFGYKRSVMTQLDLNATELDLISDYILSFKGKK